MHFKQHFFFTKKKKIIEKVWIGFGNFHTFFEPFPKAILNMFRSNILVVQSPVPRDPLARQNIPLHRPLHPGLRRGVPHAAEVAAAVDEPGADPGAQVHLLRRQAEVPHPRACRGSR